jgi:hypothetical protein
VAAAEAYAPNSANSLEQRSFSSANAYLPALQIFDGQSSAALNPASNASDASYFTNERSTPTAIQTGGDSPNSPVQSLMNLFAQQDALLNSNPSDATNGVMNFMQQQDQLAMNYLNNPGSTPEQSIGTSTIQPIPDGANIQSVNTGDTTPTAGDALNTGLANPIAGLTQLGDALGLPQPPSPDAVTSALQTGLSNPLGGLTQLGDALGLPQPPSPDAVTSALQTGLTDPKAGLTELGLPALPVPNLPAPSTIANDLQTGLSNPVQGLVNLTNDLNPFKWL